MSALCQGCREKERGASWSWLLKDAASQEAAGREEQGGRREREMLQTEGTGGDDTGNSTQGRAQNQVSGFQGAGGAHRNAGLRRGDGGSVRWLLLTSWVYLEQIYAATHYLYICSLRIIAGYHITFYSSSPSRS